MARILKLPRRKWAEIATPDVCELITRHLKTPAGDMVANSMQAIGLIELADYGGVFLQGGVGKGKTLFGALCPSVVEGCERPLLVVPAGLRDDKTPRELRKYAEHWKIRPIRIDAYETISRASGGHVLGIKVCETCSGTKCEPGARPGPCSLCKGVKGETPCEGCKGSGSRIPPCKVCRGTGRGAKWVGYLPDLLIFDEGHRLKNRRAACTKKVMRYVKQRRADGFTVRVVIMSGTMAKRELEDFAHLAWLVNPEMCPVPSQDHQGEIKLWGGCLNEGVKESCWVEPGALELFGGTGETPLTRARTGVRDRIFETPGYIATKENDVAGCTLIVKCHQIPVPPEVQDAFASIKKWIMPCSGLSIGSGIELWRHCRELATDFYYRPKVPPPVEWMNKRKAWHKGLRAELRNNRRMLDSEEMVEAEVRAQGKTHSLWEVYEDWCKIKPSYDLDNEAVWVSTYCLDYVRDLAEKLGPCLIWTEWPIVGQRIAKALGIEYYGQGGLNSKGAYIELEDGSRSAVASIRANNTGRNLQTIWSKAVVTSAPPTGTENEQMIGRLHRPNQLADEVEFHYLIACLEQRNGFEQSLRDADFHSELLDSDMKMREGKKSIDLIMPRWRMIGPAWEEPLRA